MLFSSKQKSFPHCQYYFNLYFFWGVGRLPPNKYQFNHSCEPQQTVETGTACWCTSPFLFPEITMIRYNMQEKIPMFCCSHLQTILWLTASTTIQSYITSIFLIRPLYCYHKCVNTSCSFVQHESIWFPKYSGLFRFAFFFLYPWICKDLHDEISLTNRIFYNSLNI